jgi:hypothetical protein
MTDKLNTGEGFILISFWYFPFNVVNIFHVVYEVCVQCEYAM